MSSSNPMLRTQALKKETAPLLMTYTLLLPLPFQKGGFVFPCHGIALRNLAKVH